MKIVYNNIELNNMGLMKYIIHGFLYRRKQGFNAQFSLTATKGFNAWSFAS